MRSARNWHVLQPPHLRGALQEQPPVQDNGEPNESAKQYRAGRLCGIGPARVVKGLEGSELLIAPKGRRSIKHPYTITRTVGSPAPAC